MSTIFRYFVEHLNKMNKKKIYPTSNRKHDIKLIHGEENVIPVDLDETVDYHYEEVSFEKENLDLFNCSRIEDSENLSIQNVIQREFQSLEQQRQLCHTLRLRYLFAEARYMQKAEELRKLEENRFEAALEGRFSKDESLNMHNVSELLEQEVKDSHCKRKQLRNKFLFEYEKFVRSCQKLNVLKKSL